MGIYIKGMKMPDHCMECEIAIEDNDYDKHCPFTKVECSNIARQVNCPLIEVPEPHGRLIDADTLMQYFNVYKYEEWTSAEVGELINNALTVIEGSE
jgi:hypothetical protein